VQFRYQYLHPAPTTKKSNERDSVNQVERGRSESSTHTLLSPFVTTVWTVVVLAIINII